MYFHECPIMMWLLFILYDFLLLFCLWEVPYAINIPNVALARKENIIYVFSIFSYLMLNIEYTSAIKPKHEKNMKSEYIV